MKPRDLWTDDEFIREYGMQARKYPLPFFLGKLQREGWTGPMPVYLIFCPDCRLYTITYPHGKGRLQCHACRRRFDHLFRRWLKDALLNPHKHTGFVFVLFAIVWITLRIYGV